jgi:hypothetical protein
MVKPIASQETRTQRIVDALRQAQSALNKSINDNGSIRAISMADADAVNGSIYYSTTAGKLVFKDNSGTVHALY